METFLSPKTFFYRWKVTQGKKNLFLDFFMKHIFEFGFWLFECENHICSIKAHFDCTAIDSHIMHGLKMQLINDKYWMNSIKSLKTQQSHNPKSKIDKSHKSNKNFRQFIVCLGETWHPYKELSNRKASAKIGQNIKFVCFPNYHKNLEKVP